MCHSGYSYNNVKTTYLMPEHLKAVAIMLREPEDVPSLKH